MRQELSATKLASSSIALWCHRAVRCAISLDEDTTCHSAISSEITQRTVLGGTTLFGYISASSLTSRVSVACKTCPLGFTSTAPSTSTPRSTCKTAQSQVHTDNTTDTRQFGSVLVIQQTHKGQMLLLCESCVLKACMLLSLMKLLCAIADWTCDVVREADSGSRARTVCYLASLQYQCCLFQRILATHHALHALQAGGCSLAVVAGVSLLLKPDTVLGLCSMQSCSYTSRNDCDIVNGWPSNIIQGPSSIVPG